jgi:hypothetical protein
MPNRTIQPLQFGDEIIYIEVSDVEQQGETQQLQNRWQQVNALDQVREAGTQVHATVKALCATMQSALKDTQPDEWSLELNFGFKGQAGIPFVTQGEANGAVKVTATWKKSTSASG